MPNMQVASPIKKDTYSLDAGYAPIKGARCSFRDSDVVAGVLTINSQDSRECVFVKNSGTAISPGQALNFSTFGTEVAIATVGQKIHGYAAPAINGSISTTIPANAYFWMIKEGRTSFLGDGSTIAAGDKVVVSGLTSGSVRSNLAGGVVYSEAAASTAVTATTVATKFDKNYTFAANTLQAGDVIRVAAEAIASATNSTDTLTLDLMIGATVVATTGAIDVANSDTFTFMSDIVIRTSGASGTVVATTNVNTATGNATFKSIILGSTAIDTTATQQIAVRATWSTNNAGNSARLDVLDISKLNNVVSDLTGGTATAACSTAVLFRGYANCQW